MVSIKKIQAFCCQCGSQLTAAETNGALIKALRDRGRRVDSLLQDAYFAMSAGDMEAAARYLRKARQAERVIAEDG